MVDPRSLTVDACLAAVSDAGLTPDDIDGPSTYPGGVGMGMRANHYLHRNGASCEMLGRIALNGRANAAQLRHEAGERQVAGARTAVVTSGGGTPSGVLLLRRDQT
jgi:hypothetical protein